jgi:hypothetical protein
VPADPRRAEHLACLAEMTAMLTLALHGERQDLRRYAEGLAQEGADVVVLLQSAVVLYAEAFGRLGELEGFDPVEVSQRIALREAGECWGAPEDHRPS